MTGDYTRDTFRPWLHYSGVRQQQGRVHMDADWNELVDIGHHVGRTTGVDVIGPTGMPEAAPGFLIAPAPSAPGSDLLIGEGRAYLNGILVEHRYGPTTLTKISGSGAASVWEVRAGGRLMLGQWLGPDSAPMSDLTHVASIVAPQAGDNGLQKVTLNKDFGSGTKIVRPFASFLKQPHLPNTMMPTDNGFHLAYLDVWEREITSLEDGHIADVALGGPDTAIRTQVIWQVRLMPLAPLIASGAVGNPPMCKSFVPGWTPGPNLRLKLMARALASQAQTNPCELPADGGYRSLENHLYRVEIHRGGVQGSSPILVKWSRDNAIHRTRLLDVVDGSLVVEEIGKDDVTALATDDWVEVRDEARILRGEPGFFVEIGEVVGTRLGIRTILDPVTQAELTQAGKPNASVLPTKGLVRRWEGGKPVTLTPGQDLALENGVVVKSMLGADWAGVGDYWLIAARSLTASVEWPIDPASNGPAAMPPHGIAHHYCPLAIVEKTAAGWSVKDDCRSIFPPLTKLESFFYLGGDGQEAMPDLTATGNAAYVLLDAPLRVGIARGRTPVPGHPVRFRVTDTSNPGRLSIVPGTPAADVILNTPNEIVLRTNPGGVAAVAFSLPKARHQNHVVAEMLNAGDPSQADVLHLPIQFTANTSVASEVAYDPGNCVYQSVAAIQPGIAKTVQAAIDKLCPRLEFLPLGGDGQTLCTDKPGPWPLVVGTFWGKEALRDVRIAFRVLSGDATVQPATATTDASGLAETRIIAGSNAQKDNGIVIVEASVVAGPIPAKPEKLFFAARFLDAKCIYLGPEVCPPGQKETGSNSLADIINYLCKNIGSSGKDPGLHVTNVIYASRPKGAALAQLKAYDIIAPEALAQGLVFLIDGPIDPNCLKGSLVGHVMVDLPFPVTIDEMNTFWPVDTDRRPFAFQPVRLDGSITLSDGKSKGSFGAGLVWKPAKATIEWLVNGIEQAYAGMKLPFRVPAEALLHGNRIYSPQTDKQKQVLYLDGDLYLDRKQATGIVYKSGDGRKGGEFKLPFVIGRPKNGKVEFDPKNNVPTPVEPGTSVPVKPGTSVPVKAGTNLNVTKRDTSTPIKKAPTTPVKTSPAGGAKPVKPINQ
jgi:hypothetical protein